VLAWTWAGSTVGNLVFFDRPWVALYGGLAMGAVVGPYLWKLEYLRRST
jgi:putative membrane protein